MGAFSYVGLSPAMLEFVQRTEAFVPAVPMLEAQREAYRQMARSFTPARPAGVSSIDLWVEGGAAPLRLRCYQPSGLMPGAGWPTVLYCHGGGWSVGDLDTHDFITAALCASLGAVVVAVDYRLAPEHPFPAAFDDCLAAWHALQRRATALDIDRRRVALAGDSAGGNLVAAVSLALRQAGGQQPRAQALVYPVLAGPSAHGDSFPSHVEQANAPLLSRIDLLLSWGAYVPRLAQRRDWRASPLSASDLSGMPPTFVAVAEYDPVRDEGLRYAKRLQEAAGAVELHQGRGLVHGCLRARGRCSETDRLYGALVGFLSRQLH